MEQKLVHWNKDGGKSFKDFCDELLNDHWFIQQIIPIETGTLGSIKSAYIIIYKYI